jgi:hypothetical protein
MKMANKQVVGRANEERFVKQNMEITDSDMKKILKAWQLCTQNFSLWEEEG